MSKQLILILHVYDIRLENEVVGFMNVKLSAGHEWTRMACLMWMESPNSIVDKCLMYPSF